MQNQTDALQCVRKLRLLLTPLDDTSPPVSLHDNTIEILKTQGELLRHLAEIEIALAGGTIVRVTRPVEVRDSVGSFAEEMERILRENDHKGGWGGCTNGYLLSRLIEEVAELSGWMYGKGEPSDSLSIIQAGKEAIDVANFAMMLRENLLKEKSHASR